MLLERPARCWNDCQWLCVSKEKATRHKRPRGSILNMYCYDGVFSFPITVATILWTRSWLARFHSPTEEDQGFLVGFGFTLRLNRACVELRTRYFGNPLEKVLPLAEWTIVLETSTVCVSARHNHASCSEFRGCRRWGRIRLGAQTLDTGQNCTVPELMQVKPRLCGIGSRGGCSAAALTATESSRYRFPLIGWNVCWLKWCRTRAVESRHQVGLAPGTEACRLLGYSSLHDHSSKRACTHVLTI